MMHLFHVGEHGEILIVAERVASIQAVPAVDRAGRIIGPPDYNHAAFEGSIITLDNGTSIPVPQTPDEVGMRMRDAIVRKTVMPS